MSRLDASHPSNAVETWAEDFLCLVEANAGPTCLTTALRNAAAPERGPDLRAAAAVCRAAGARAAFACIEALPIAARRLPTWAERARWWTGLSTLARGAPDCVEPLAARSETVLKACGGAGFEDFVAAGLKASGRDKTRRRAFFRLETPEARRLIELADGGSGFAALERGLKLYGTALWDEAPKLRALGVAGARRVSIAGDLIRMPARFRGVTPGHEASLYRAALAHAQAHLVLGRGRMPVATLKPLQIALVGLVEDARIEALAMRRFPGLRALWAPWHVAAPSRAMTAEGLMARLARALFDPDYVDPDGFVEKGRRLFAQAEDRLDDPALSRAIGGLLGNDVGQMRVRFDAKGYASEPAYRDDNLGLWTFEDEPDADAETIEQAVEAARPRPEESDDGRDSGEPPREDAGRAREIQAEDRGAEIARYPEWDRAAAVERADWTTVREVPPPSGDARALEAALDRLPGFRAKIARLVRGARIGQAARLKRRPDGFDLDLDATVEAGVALRLGELPDERIHRARGKRSRDVATIVLVDVSQSTADRVGADSVLDIEKLAVAALGEAMAALGDAFAVLSFASSGRDDVRLTRIKDFPNDFGQQARSRLAGLRPGLSTRLGAALRHAGAELPPIRAHRKLVIALTDGEPSDIDVADPLDLVEDARRAALALKSGGVDLFGVTLGPARSGTLIFGRSNAMPVARIEDLPARLADLYFWMARL
jgi:nitric oxide reductase NorD protein